MPLWFKVNAYLFRQHWADLALCGPRGDTQSFWMADYWDRFIRDERHLVAVIEYIHDNPLNAGLSDLAESWVWSSVNPDAT